MRILVYLILSWSLISCVAHKKVTYFNDLNEAMEGELNIPTSPLNTLGPGDYIEIQISSISIETNTFFETDQSSQDEGFGGNVYRISDHGKIDLPLVGEVDLMGLNLDEARERIKESLLAYVQKPTVNVRLANYRITILGEVRNPGVYEIPTAEANILEALGYAGDMTIYGVRDNVLLIRNSGGQKRFKRFNMSSSEIFSDPDFFLQNNDVLYVQPTKGLTSKDDNIYRILPLVISSLTFIAVVISLNQ